MNQQFGSAKLKNRTTLNGEWLSGSNQPNASIFMRLLLALSTVWKRHLAFCEVIL